jgi:CBS domain-containing protein
MIVQDRLMQELRSRRSHATARELMTANPRSIDQSATVRQAAEYMCLTGASAAPVIDDAGRPLGVVSRTDVLRHLGRGADLPFDLEHAAHDPSERASMPVHRIMTRAVFSVHPETPGAKVIAKLTALEVQRLFVVDGYGVLIGVIDVYDLLRRLIARKPSRRRARTSEPPLAVLAS